MRTTISIIVSERYGNIRTVSDREGNVLYCLKDIRKIFDLSREDSRLWLREGGVADKYLLPNRAAGKYVARFADLNNVEDFLASAGLFASSKDFVNWLKQEACN